uniref:Gustatory receptor n=1 Tax=Ditylenchus dipsaci TaxID=166011 RepID=A0A915E261_9BILA
MTKHYLNNFRSQKQIDRALNGIHSVFLIHWQIRNHLYSISKTLFTTLRKQASHCKDHTKLKRNLRATLVSCLVIAVAYCIVQVSHFTIVYSIDYYKTSLQRIIFFNHSAICAYGFCVTNIVLCAFIVVTKSIALELDRFNRIFPKMCIPSASTSANLLKSMATHNQLAEKISKADKIFQGYLMSMMAILSPAIIISFITLLRREDWLGVLYSLNDILCCSFQLFALTYNPAQIYTKFRAARDQVHKISANLIEYDMKACQIAQIFANNVAHSHVGFSLGGHTVITKSLILTMMSLVFPYVILCLQLNLGTTFYTFYQPTSTHNPTN